MTLATYLTDDGVDPLADELAAWLAGSRRFADFADAHRDKIRKKLRSATDEGARLDVRAELHVAFLLLADRRIDLAFEPGGSTRGGPDFAVAFRGHSAFNLEVTRLRTAPDAAAIGRVVLAKLRQLTAAAPNILVVAVNDAAIVDAEIAAAIGKLRSRADAADPTLLARGRLEDRRAFYQRFHRLGGVVAWSEGHATRWANPSARIEVPGRALDAVLVTLRQGREV